MTMRRLLGVLLLLLLPCARAWAQFAVIDAAAIVRLEMELRQQLNMYRELIEHTKHQIQQIQNQIQQIQHAYTTVQHGAQNLLTLDLNNMADLLTLSDQLERKFQYAEYLGYTSQRAWEQAQGLYPQIKGVLNGPQQRALRRQWAAAERSTAHVALETQAIAAEQHRYAQEWQEALQRAVQAKGALQIEQAQAQMLGIQGSQLQQIQQQLATQARHTTEQTLRDASQTELELAAAEAATGAYNVSDYTPAGRLLAMPRTGKE
jgi:type IV secretion system protein TrbJ